jgi:hypothetical protein
MGGTVEPWRRAIAAGGAPSLGGAFVSSVRLGRTGEHLGFVGQHAVVYPLPTRDCGRHHRIGRAVARSRAALADW